ncbi:MAG: histidine phosphatase family protein [Oscillospiraceae bacterium]|nr:histidine phosphatase family protein [Oscillospiraceae bacterium]
MKLLIIRHGDPDYSIDSLTERGDREAELLASYLLREQERTGKAIDAFYLSPLGRAQRTARFTLEKLGRSGETLPWLREFNAEVRVYEDPELEKGFPQYPGVKSRTRLSWDILPSYLKDRPDYYDPVDWRGTEVCRVSDTNEVYDRVTAGLDELLAKWGYVRDGRFYRVEKESHATLALFCHFGVECVLLSHLIGVSPFALWHGLVALPTSMTLVHTEEREKGLASFRVAWFGSLPHFAESGQEPSFHGRFCECYEDDTRH